MNNGRLSVLCIDDDNDHVELLRRAATKDARPLDLHAETSGDAALRWLRTPPNRPDIILLDVEMPGRDGISVVRELKADPRLKVIPVLMLSGVSEARRVRLAYECGANMYFLKPSTLEKYTELVALFLTLWGALALLPGDEVPSRMNIVR